MSTGRRSVNIYDYPEHLNPFFEDDVHNRIRFWDRGKKIIRSGSFSFSDFKSLPRRLNVSTPSSLRKRWESTFTLRSFRSKTKTDSDSSPNTSYSSRINSENSKNSYSNGLRYTTSPSNTNISREEVIPPPRASSSLGICQTEISNGRLTPTPPPRTKHSSSSGTLPRKKRRAPPPPQSPTTPTSSHTAVVIPSAPPVELVKSEESNSKIDSNQTVQEINTPVTLTVTKTEKTESVVVENVNVPSTSTSTDQILRADEIPKEETKTEEPTKPDDRKTESNELKKVETAEQKIITSVQTKEESDKIDQAEKNENASKKDEKLVEQISENNPKLEETEKARTDGKIEKTEKIESTPVIVITEIDCKKEEREDTAQPKSAEETNFNNEVSIYVQETKEVKSSKNEVDEVEAICEVKGTKTTSEKPKEMESSSGTGSEDGEVEFRKKPAEKQNVYPIVDNTPTLHNGDLLTSKLISNGVHHQPVEEPEPEVFEEHPNLEDPDQLLKQIQMLQQEVESMTFAEHHSSLSTNNNDFDSNNIDIDSISEMKDFMKTVDNLENKPKRRSWQTKENKVML